MRCKYCFEEVEQNSDVCSRCGKAISKLAQAISDAEDERILELMKKKQKR